MEFSEDIVKLLKDRYPDKDIYNMSLEELKDFKEEIENLRREYSLLELANKLSGNGAYGAAAAAQFYFYNVSLAGDITGECKILTKTMWQNLEYFFHETIWERKDLWEKFEFELDESKHDWYRTQPISVYSDTDSVYTTYGTLFECMTPEYQEKYKTDRQKVDWILKFNKEFVDPQNNQWCDDMYRPRHGKSIHEFELETVNKACIYLKKKKYLKGLIYNKGKHLDKPKMSGTGIEIIKSTTPKLCREILTDLTKSLMFETGTMGRKEYIEYFNKKIQDWRKVFYKAPIEDISQSVGIGAYKKYVINDEDELILGKQCPVSVHSIARYNHLAHKNGERNKRQFSGKIKYYNVIVGGSYKKPLIGYFGFPAGELPSWAPPMDKTTQWRKTVIEPINRFLEVMDIPEVGYSNVTQLTLF